MKEEMDYLRERLLELLAIDSPTGFTRKAQEYLMKELTALGYAPRETVKGGVLVDLGGPTGREDGLLLSAHIDTLGGMVREITPQGRLKITNVGGLRATSVETENCRVYTRFSGVYSGTLQLMNASVHVNSEVGTAERSYDSCEILLDEPVESKEDVKKLGIRNGDFVCFDTRSQITDSGYIKSRFLDDKLSVAVILALAKELRDKGITPSRRLWAHFTVYEEVGHGGAASIPEGVRDILAVDMGCVGDGLECTERQVSICAKDRIGPYNYDMVTELVQAAEKAGADYVIDLYPHYSSDADVTVTAGHDMRHGLIGPGVYASHGYERSHLDGAENTLKLLAAYVQ